MTASSTKHAAAVLALLLPGLLPTGAALADDAPESLAPRRAETVIMSPNADGVSHVDGSHVDVGHADAVAKPSAGVPRSDAFPEVTSPADSKVQVQDLANVDPGSTGVLTSGNGGFGTDLWAGSSMGIVQKVMPSLPSAASSHTMRSLMRRLLLTAANVPAGKPIPGDSLTKIRADRLWAMGDAEGLSSFLKGVPSSSFTPELRRTAAEAALLAGDTAQACAQSAGLGQGNDDGFAVKLGIVCQFASGKTKEAALSVDVLREQKLNDPAFFIAADALSGVAPGKLEAFNQLSPLTMAMARAAKIALPEAAAANATHPAVLRALATDAAATLEARLVAAEKAEAMGVLDVDLLRQAYEGVTFSAQELAAPVGADKGPRGRAMLYRATIQQSQPNVKAELISKAVSLSGDSSPAYFTTARLYANELVNIKPTPEQSWFAYTASRALLAAGKADAARPWLQFLRSQQVQDSAGAIAGLWPLLRMTMAEDERVLPASALEMWRKVRADQPGDVGQRRAMICYGLLAALGEKLPDDAWLPLYDGPAMAAGLAPRPAIWQGLHTGAEDLRLGQTVLMSMVSLGDNGLSQVDPATLFQVVWSLRHIGLDAEARALAIEAAIANGV